MGAKRVRVCALILTVSAAQAADQGFYFGASAGQAKYDFDVPAVPFAVIGFLPPVAGFVPDPSWPRSESAVNPIMPPAIQCWRRFRRCSAGAVAAR